MLYTDERGVARVYQMRLDGQRVEDVARVIGFLTTHDGHISHEPPGLSQGVVVATPERQQRRVWLHDISPAGAPPAA